MVCRSTSNYKIFEGRNKDYMGRKKLKAFDAYKFE